MLYEVITLLLIVGDRQVEDQGWLVGLDALGFAVTVITSYSIHYTKLYEGYVS